MPSDPAHLLGRMAQVKRWSLLLFFGGGALMALMALFIPTHDAPSAPGGRTLFMLTGLIGLGIALLTWRRPSVMRSERFDGLFMVSGNLCALISTLAETLLFGSQLSAMVLLWPMVFAAGFLSRRLLWGQIVLGSACLLIMVYAKALLVTKTTLWPIEALVVGVPVAFTGLAVSFFREAAVQEAQELARMVRTDPLTGLANRRALFDDFGTVLSRVPVGHRIALVMLDLDHFKRVNDQFGHQVGDSVLQRFAAALQTHARDGDLLVRMGGEEFLWVTAEPDTERLLVRVEAARTAYSSSPEAREVTVSAGVVHWSAPVNATSGHLSELISAADSALYRAKEAGRDRIHLFTAA